MAKDLLARGARSANFGSMSHISQSKWDAAFASDADSKVKPPAPTSKISTQESKPSKN